MTHSTAETKPQPQDLTPTKVPWAAVALFAVLACGLAWLVQIPLWRSGEGLEWEWFMPLTGVMMFTPAVAALIVIFAVVRPANKARYLGLTPVRPARRTVLLCVAWMFIWLAIGVAASFLAVALGWATLDFSLPLLQGIEEATPEQLLVTSLIFLPIGVVLSSIPALGEELGWRGFLTTALAPLGFWPSAVLIGVLWGVWHAPVMLLGYNFAEPNMLGVVYMIGFCFFVGILLQWSRYWARNVWVAGVGHGALNATAGTTFIFLQDIDRPVLQTMLGVPGWIVMGVVAVILVATGLIGRRFPQPLVPAPDKTAVNLGQTDGTGQPTAASQPGSPAGQQPNAANPQTQDPPSS